MNPRAGAMLFPNRNRLALALTLGLHLLVAMLWLQEPRPRPPGPAEVVSVLLRPQPPARPARPPSAAIPPRAQPRPRPGQAPAAPAAAAVPAPEPAAPAAASQATEEARAADAQAGAGFALDLAKRQAGRIDRDLRQGKSGVPAEADTPWARFRRGLEAAHVEPGNAVQLDSYAAPDGVVIYRQRVGSRTFCRRTGGVGPGVAGMVGVNDAANIPCPSGAAWKREP